MQRYVGWDDQHKEWYVEFGLELSHLSKDLTYEELLQYRNVQVGHVCTQVTPPLWHRDDGLSPQDSVEDYDLDRVFSIRRDNSVL